MREVSMVLCDTMTRMESPNSNSTTMMRSIHPRDSELSKLIRKNLWWSVRTRCQEHPDECCPSASAVSGVGSTMLALAVRAGAPLVTLEALIEANQGQLAVIHQHHGTILHEAFQYQADYSVIRFLLQSMIQYQHLNQVSSNLLKHGDNMGRTTLHHLVIRIIQERTTQWSSSILESLVLAYPPALQRMDSDGNTPLLLALLCPSTERLTPQDESYLCKMIQFMVETDPSIAILKKANVHLWRCQGFLLGSGHPNPLTYALLYGRSHSTIQVLLEAQHNVARVNPCLTIASNHHEVPLHLAVTMRCNISLLSRLMEHGAVNMGDVYQLTSLDWLWIRHVVDWCSNSAASEPVSPSTRRYLSPAFLDWHRRVSKEMSNNNVLERDSYTDRLQDELWKKVCLLLPAAATTNSGSDDDDNSKPWPPLHAACFVKTPLAMIQLALKRDESSSVRTFHAGRLPLHYVCARRPYYATVPIGASSRPRLLKELKSPIHVLLDKFPQAVRVRDLRNQQLPLHIAVERGNVEDIHTLFSKYPISLEQRDGKTKLFPFQQAAATGGSLDTVFSLLREHPTLVASGIRSEGDVPAAG